MASTLLVDTEIQNGRRVVEALDKEGLTVSSAFWFRESEADRFRLVLAVPKVQTEGPTSALRTIEGVLERNHIDLPIWDIDVVSSTDETTKLLRRVVKTKPEDIAGIRFTNNFIGNRFIEDAYIYRST